MHPLPVELPAGVSDGPAELPCELVGLVDAKVQPASSPSHEGDRDALSGRVCDLHALAPLRRLSSASIASATRVYWYALKR